MLIPKFWAKAQTQTQLPKANAPVTVTCWRGSNIDLSDALKYARLAVEERAIAMAAGKQIAQDYPSAPIREDIIEEISDSHGNTLGIVTRSNCGFTVLNTDRMMFIDIDRSNYFRGFFKTLFGKKLSPEEELKQFETDKIALLEKIYTDHKLGGRVYRTARGLRAIVSSEEIHAEDARVSSILKSCFADTLYLRLCEVQKCFRARLSPKPKRVKLKTPKQKFPFESEAEKLAHGEWLAKYNDSCERFGVCQHIKDIGNNINIASELKALIRFHDEQTLVRGTRTLA